MTDRKDGLESNTVLHQYGNKHTPAEKPKDTSGNNKKKGSLTDEEHKKLDKIEQDLKNGKITDYQKSQEDIKNTLDQYKGVSDSFDDAYIRAQTSDRLSDYDRETMSSILHQAFNESGLKTPATGGISYSSGNYVDSNIHSTGNKNGIPIKKVNRTEMRKKDASIPKDDPKYKPGGELYNPWSDKSLSTEEVKKYISKHGDYRYPVFLGDRLSNGRKYYYNKEEAMMRARAMIKQIAPHYTAPIVDKILPPAGARLTPDGYWVDGTTGKFLGTAPEGYNAPTDIALTKKGKWVRDKNGISRYLIDNDDKKTYTAANSTGYYNDKGYWVVSKQQTKPDNNGNIYDTQTGKFVGNIYRPGIELGVGYTGPDREVYNPIDYEGYNIGKSDYQHTDYTDTSVVTNTDDELENKKNEIFDTATIDKISSSFNLFPRSAIDRFDKFSQYGFFDVHDTSTYYREYLFFTKPHLNLGGLESYDSSYYDLITTQYSKVISSLTKGGPGFIPLLTNSVVPGDGAELPDSTPIDMETMTNIYGANITYKSQSLESTYNQEFSLSFNDTKFLDVYMLFHFWDTYSTLKALGYMQPLDIYMPPHNILEDQISVYKITVAEDYRHIVHYAKFTGVYPRLVPKSIFNTLESGPIKIPITFRAFKVNDMEPWILEEFNAISKPMLRNRPTPKSSELKQPLFGFGTGVDNRWKVCPIVTLGENHGRPVYFLEWEV